MRVPVLSCVLALLFLALLGGAPAARATMEDDARAPISVGAVRLDPCQPEYGGYCGHIDRPLDPSGRIAGTQRVAFEWYPRAAAGLPSLGTIAAQEGGPGYSTTGSRDGYVRLFAPLRDRRDILLIDKRGTGKSDPIDCPDLQRPGLPGIADYTACGRALGAAAWLYGTAFAADDVAAVLDALRLGKIDLYGDSYGTFFGQVFAARHPDRLRTLILDSAYPVIGLTPWFASEYETAPRALRLVCARSPSCAALPGDPVARLDRLVRALRRLPVHGSAPDQDGHPRAVTADPATLFLLLDFAGNAPVVWRDFDAAARVYLDQSDALPLLRLLAESLGGNALGAELPQEYSVGLFAAVQCADYPQPFDYAATLPERREQVAAAVAAESALRPAVYAPFTLAEALAAPYQPIAARTCVGWPAPPPGITPARPAGGRPFPDLPVLVLNGEVDTITSPRDGREAALLFPWPRFVLVANAIHETAIGDGGVFVPPFGGDLAHCVQPIVLRFVASGGNPGDTSCAARVRPIRTVPAFAARTGEVAPAASRLPGADPAALRVAAAAAAAVGDVIARYYVTDSGSGAGLRGGHFHLAPTETGYRFALDGVRFTADLAVSGSIAWDQVSGNIRADVTLAGVAEGALRIAWNDIETDAQCTIDGTIGGAAVSATQPAP